MRARWWMTALAIGSLVACGSNGASRAERDAKGTAGTISDAAKDGAKAVGDATSNAVSKTGAAMSDGWITATINTKFVGEDLLKDSDINVDTNDHVVTLKGTVTSANARKRAVEVAKATDDVRSVVDDLKIAGAKPRNPPR